jgi:hypothetical protein
MAFALEVAARNSVGKGSMNPMFWGLSADARMKTLDIIKEARQ